MSDKRIRRLERRAATGDADAQAALLREEERNGRVCDRTIFRGLLGEWVCVDSGPNYSETGILREVYIDEIGRGIAILDRCRRRNDELAAKLSWLTDPSDGVRIPTTAVTLVQPAAQRWGALWRHW